ncbi:MAG: TonB-dependent receptor [Pseudomonadales bacterium]|nr:TonB-dependent receptor [Pseudomonadales bacterium]MBO7007052.1 TonB-dependent receptor [Pseudomonadales bacterium]
MKFTRTLLGVAIGATSIGSPIMIHAEETSRTMEEVVVTSRRRDESQQDVPLSVTAWGAEAIERVKPTTLRDFDALAPNVYIGMNTAGPGASALYIRGIGYADIEKTQSPQVGVIVDGIQMGSSTGQLIDTFDVESIEINRGPQGVLFGKNTIGGNIVVNRVKPEFNDFGFNASVELGNFDSEIYKARVNLPLVEDTLALKIGAISREREGYYDNVTLGQTAGDVDFQSFTTALRWLPTENFEVLMTYDNIDDTSQIPPQDPRFDGSNPFINRANKEEPTEYDVDQLGIQATWDINDNLSLFSVTGWHDSFDGVNQDFDGGSPAGLAIPFAQLHTLREQDFEIFTQELRLQGSISDNVDFMVGYYYYESELDFSQRTNNVLQLPAAAIGLPPDGSFPCAAIGFRPNPTVGDVFCQFPNARSTQIASEDVESQAFFGSLTWRPTDELEFMVGVRNIQEEKDAFNSYFDHSTGTFDTVGPEAEFDFSSYPTTAGVTYAIGDDWDDTIWTASGTWNYTDSNRAYINYSEGFRSGGISIRSARDPAEAPFEPENADQIEVGLKNEFFDGALQLNLAYYELTLEGGQFSSIISLPPGSIPGTTTIINNGDEAVLDGWEFEGRWLINDNFTLSFNYGSTDADNSAFQLPCDRVDGCASSIPGNPPDPSGTLRTLGGNSDSRQPEETYAVRLSYVTDIGNGTLFVDAGYKYTGEFLLVNTGAGADARTFDGDYDLWDARIAYEMRLANDQTLTFTASGKNLTDEEYREQALFLGGGTFLLPSGGPNTGFQGWGAPRTYAFEIRYSM